MLKKMFNLSRAINYKRRHFLEFVFLPYYFNLFFSLIYDYKCVSILKQ